MIASLLPAAPVLVCSKLNSGLRSSSLLSLLTVLNWIALPCRTQACGDSIKLGNDIFQKFDDGYPLWRPVYKRERKHYKNVTSLRRSAAARCFVRDAETGVAINDEPGTIGSPDKGG
jgi:hypothetical protein